MNFFGHAFIAVQRGGNAAFVLGSMLPDLATMLGTAQPASSHPELDAGIRFHHDTDAAFHGAATFVALNRLALSELRASGVRKGTARAVAHVGIELLLDLVLSDSPRATAGYRCALEAAAELNRWLSWPEQATAARFASLCAELARRPPAAADAPASAVTRRLHQALAWRPRLCILKQDANAVQSWVDAWYPQVAQARPQLLSEINARLLRRSGHLAE